MVFILRQGPVGRLNKKDGLIRYGDSHVKDKTAVLSLTWKSPYVDKTVFILRQDPGSGNALLSVVQNHIHLTLDFEYSLMLF